VSPIASNLPTTIQQQVMVPGLHLQNFASWVKKLKVLDEGGI